MSDDNNFSLGDILWEYSDYTPPEPTPAPSIPLPPEDPQAPAPPAAPVQPTIAAPQPITPPAAQPAPKAAPQAQPAAPKPTGPLPANQPAAKPAAPAPQAQPVQPVQPAAPKAAPAPQAPQAPAQAPQAAPVQTGVPETDGPDLISFTPDPKAGETETKAEPQPDAPAEGQQAPAEGTEPPAETPGEGAGPSPEEGTDPQEAEAPATEPAQEVQTPPAGGQTKPSGGRQIPTPPKKEPFRLRRERKPRPGPEVPPDASPAQLTLEYSQGLSSLRNKCITSAVFLAVLLVLSFFESGFIPIAALNGLVPREFFLPVSMALFVVVVILCFPVMKAGLVQLTNKAPNGCTLALLATIFTLADGLTLLFLGLRENTLPFFAPCGLVLTCHLMGLYLTQSTRHQACRTASSVSKPYVVTQDPNVLNNQPAFRKWIGAPKGFGSHIRTLSDGEFRFQRLTPVLLVGCIVLSLITTVAHHQPRLALWSLSALFCATATLGASMVFSLPVRMISKRLTKLGVALAGWPGVQASKGCKSALLQDYDVYPPGTVTLMTARPFGNWTMDKATSYAASVIRASGSGLAYVFDRTLRNEHGAYLGVEKLVMQDSGLVGEVQGQQVLVGNSDFMTRQGITLPQGIRAKDAVFCVIAREVAAMYVLRYNLHPAIIPALRAFFAHKLAPVLATRDFNLNPQRLRLSGRLPTDQISFPDLQRRVTLSGPNQVHSEAMVAVLCKEGLPPFAEAVIGAKRLHRAGRLASWFVNVSAVIGLILTASLSSAGALSSMCAWNLSLFLLLWLVPVFLVSLWTRQY